MGTIRSSALFFILALLFLAGGPQQVMAQKPVMVITDLYHPYQDPGDNLDLINGYALADVDLKAVILDITDAFRKDTADHPTLWKDPRGPREAGIIPVEQLNYIFNRKVRYAIGPVDLMQSETDEMRNTPSYYNGVELFLETLKETDKPLEVISFGSARVIAVAWNRDPQLLMQKISRIHLCAGTAASKYEMGSDAGANMIPGGEWNVSLDVFAFTRLLRSPLPIALYPCAGKDGGFVKDPNNSYWKLKDMSFLRAMDPRLQRYLDFAFGKRMPYDFLRAMDKGQPYANPADIQFKEFHVWESAVWIEVTDRVLIRDAHHGFKLMDKKVVSPSDQVLESGLRPCKLTEIRDDGRFEFEYAKGPSRITIYFRANPEENEEALNQVIPELFKSYSPGK